MSNLTHQILFTMSDPLSQAQIIGNVFGFLDPETVFGQCNLVSKSWESVRVEQPSTMHHISATNRTTDHVPWTNLSQQLQQLNLSES